VLDNEYSGDFGITLEEVRKLIKDYELEENEEDIKKWYDGYKIGNRDGIYNPWSLLQYTKRRVLMPYWVNTSSNDLIKLILKDSSTIKEKIESLLKDETIEVKINLETIIRGIEDNEENIWGLLLGTGYLKVVETVDVAKKIYKVKRKIYSTYFQTPSYILPI
jgi:DNA-binding transcriptional MerR regulator